MTGLAMICKMYGQMIVTDENGKKVIWVWDYANYYLVCYSSPLYAFRDRMPVENPVRAWTFAKPGTSITFGEAETIIIPEL